MKQSDESALQNADVALHASEGVPMPAVLDTGSVEINRWVIHEIPKRFSANTGEAPTLSKVLSPYDADVARFFERKISESFSKSKHQIHPIDEEHPVPILIRDQLQNEADELIGLSISLAQSLFDVQSGAMSAGLLVVMRGTYQNTIPILSVLKLDKEEGARANWDIDGMATYSVEYMKDLFLTGRTRVFKVSLFSRDETGPFGLHGWVSDPQSQGVEVADFFLNKFLGCKLQNDPQVATRQFHLEAEKFINDQVSDPETKARYETALVAELQANSREVGVRSFANHHLDVADRAAFEHSLTDAGVELTFAKDTQLIKSKLRRVQYEFESGVKVSQPAEISADIVTVAAQEDGQTELQIVDTLKNMHSRG